MFTLLSFLTVSTTSLVTEFNTWILDQYANPDSIYWIRSYEGFLDDEYLMLLSLGFDGESYVGIYQLQGDSEPFTLEGSEIENQILLQEWDQDGKPSGIWILDKEHNYLSGSWMNTKKQNSKTLDLFHIQETEDWAWPSNENWARHYYGQFSGKLAEMVLHKERLRLDGSLYLSAFKKTLLLKGNCEDLECLKVQIEVHSDTGQIAQIIGQLIQNQVIHITYKENQKPIAYYSLAEREHVAFASEPEISYHYIQDLIYPDSSPALRQKYDSFYKNAMNELPSSTERDPSQRWQNQSQGWQSIIWLNDQLISTTLFFYDNISDSIQSQQVNFDLKRNQPIHLADLFKKRVNFKQTFSQHIYRHLTQNEWHWLAPNSFKHFGLTKEGFCLVTDFHPFYGQQRIIVPYAVFQGQYTNHPVISYLHKYK